MICWYNVRTSTSFVVYVKIYEESYQQNYTWHLYMLVGIVLNMLKEYMKSLKKLNHIHLNLDTLKHAVLPSYDRGSRLQYYVSLKRSAAISCKWWREGWAELTKHRLVFPTGGVFILNRVRWVQILYPPYGALTLSFIFDKRPAQPLLGVVWCTFKSICSFLQTFRSLPLHINCRIYSVLFDFNVARRVYYPNMTDNSGKSCPCLAVP